MRKCLLYILSISLSSSSNGQLAQYNVPSNHFLREIKHNGNKIKGTIYWGTSKYNLLPIAQNPFKKNTQLMVICNGNAYIVIDGTGLIYQLNGDLQDNSIEFQRVDSTFYAGNNFNSYVFGYKNQVYSIGGYGFWKSNGQLRFFSHSTHDWNIEPLNKELTITKHEIYPNVWFDEYNQQLNSLGYSSLNQATSESGKNINYKFDSLYRLDLPSKTWHTIGVLSEDFRNTIPEYIPIINTPRGLLVSNNSKIDFEIWNIQDNSIYKLSKEAQKNFPISELDEYIFWHKENYIYTYNRISRQADSILLLDKDLIKTNKKIYTTSNLNSIFVICLGTLLLIPIILGGFKKFRKRKSTSVPAATLKGSTESNGIFSEIEKLLISLLIKNFKNGRLTSIDEVNYVLGISSKSVNMQKRTRSDVINSINTKFQIYLKTDTILIQRKNSEFDQRVKEFYINDIHIEQLQKM